MFPWLLTLRRSSAETFPRRAAGTPSLALAQSEAAVTALATWGPPADGLRALARFAVERVR